MQVISLFTFLFAAYYVFYKSFSATHFRFLLFAGIFFRVLLLFSVPNLSDDVYRFIWDGRLMMNGVNPYAHLPTEIMRSASLTGITQELFQQLNSPSYYTIYPPVLQSIFWLTAKAFPDNIFGTIICMKAIILLAEVGTVLVLPLVLSHLQLPKHLSLLYTLNPLIIAELTGNVHFDAVMIFFFIAAFLLLLHKKIYLSALFLGLSISCDSNGSVTSVITNKDEEIKCEFVGVAVGVSPNISFLERSGIETDKGVLVDEYFETNIPEVYAIGDCAQYRKPLAGRKAIEQVWYTGRIHGETLGQTLAGKKIAYNPGPWFNSAKFFDIEYQTYGKVDAKPNEEESSFYWEHPDGKICFRAVCNKKDESIVGFNALGMRLNHNVCDKWLQEKKNINEVMSNLYQINFDPEFFDKHEKAILSAYNQQTGKAIKSTRKKGFALFNW